MYLYVGIKMHVQEAFLLSPNVPHNVLHDTGVTLVEVNQVSFLVLKFCIRPVKELSFCEGDEMCQTYVC